MIYKKPPILDPMELKKGRLVCPHGESAGNRPPFHSVFFRLSQEAQEKLV